MGKRMISAILAVFMAMQLCACGETAQMQSTDAGSKAGAEGETVSIDEAEHSDMDVSAVADLGGRDNTLDPYAYTVHKSFDLERTEDGSSNISGVKCTMGENNTYLIGTHLMIKEGSSYGSWQEFVTVDGSGELTRERWEDPNQKIEIGTILGTDRYVLFKVDVFRDEEMRQRGLGDIKYSFEIMSEEQQFTKLSLPQMDQEKVDSIQNLIYSLVMDEDDYIYYLRSKLPGEDMEYYLEILSPNGEYVRTTIGERQGDSELISAYDGSVLLFRRAEKETGKTDEIETQLYRIDRETCELTLLVSLEDVFPGKISSAALLDEETLIYTDHMGIYQMDLQSEEKETLYLWTRHGISLSEVEEMRVYRDGRIRLVYRNDERQWYYLELSPTTEQLPIRVITFATTEGQAKRYRPMITRFNKTHPNCSVEIKTDYEGTALLTQLIAGDGPVLIDTSVIGFAENKKLWEPLDEVMDGLGIYEQLQPSAMELGKIDGTLFGIIDNFWIDTVITGDTQLQGWDYDTFVQCISERPDRKAIVNSYELETDGSRFLSDFFVHSLEDSYLFDRENAKTSFQEEKFRELLRLTKQYVVRQDYVDAGKEVLDGSVLCNRLSVYSPEEIALLRIIYGEDINYIGYPGKEGASSYLNARPPLAIRRTASKEDKEVAAAFLADMLSYEAQMSMRRDVNFYMSVRKDVLEKQIGEMNEKTSVQKWEFADSRPYFLEDQVNVEKDRETLYELIDHAKPRQEIPSDLAEILRSELSLYFSGQITEDDVCRNLDNRVGLYLKEHN